jgi:6-phosphogluconolactonase
VELHAFESPNAYKEAVVNAIEQEIKRADGVARIALSGGSTPQPVYEALAERRSINFAHVSLYQVDERYVPHTDPRSNYRMIQRTLSEPVQAQLRAFYTFDTSKPIDKAVALYENQLRRIKAPLFDVVVLGMGNDGHTASLFPGSPALEEQDKFVAHTTTDTFDVSDRLTLTFPAIFSCRTIILLLKGNDKRQTWEKVVNGKQTYQELPAKKLLMHRNLHVFTFS